MFSVSPKEKMFSESWLQELLILNPSLLPTKEFDDSWNDLIPLGREVSVTAGAIDNLYITSEGLICLVETKLWRNPDAHRTVVAQVLDYAKDLSKMPFDGFKETIEKSTFQEAKPDFWFRITKYLKNINKIEFQSKVQETLNKGRFLLLVVGDKIYPEVAMLIETIQSAPNLEFKIGLIEIQMYKTSKETPWPLLLIPKVVRKTKEDIRTIVKIIYEEKRPEIEVEAFEEEAPKTKINKRTFEKSMPEEFADIFIPVFDTWVADGFNIYWGTAGFSVRFFWKGRIRSIIDIYPDYISLLTEDMVRRKGLPFEPYHNYRNEIDEIPIVRRLFTERRRYLYLRDISLEDFRVIIKVTDKMIRDFKKLEGTNENR